MREKVMVTPNINPECNMTSSETLVYLNENARCNKVKTPIKSKKKKVYCVSWKHIPMNNFKIWVKSLWNTCNCKLMIQNNVTYLTKYMAN